MVRFFILLAIMTATALVLAVLTPTVDGVSATQWFGMPVVGFASDAPAILQVGAGTGVMVVGVGGFGIVCITLYGAGVLFATGQLSAGLLSIGQLSVGVIFLFGQVGGGFIAFGQLVFGGLTGGQVPVGFDGKAFLRELNAELSRVLAFR
jgi:hypothetical protein